MSAYSFRKTHTDIMKKYTQLTTVGRDAKFTGVAVNPALVRASTIVFDSVAEMETSAKQRNDGVEYYGRRGTSTTFAFTQAMCELENAAGCYVYPCGTAAITACLLSFLSAGDHLLMVDSVYEPTRDFANGLLARMGVSTTFFDPLCGTAIKELIRDNTKVVFLESPGSLTMEVQDVPAIVNALKEHEKIVSMIDNTYATPINFKPLDYGVDISIHSATKYLSGHSDIMLGVASANEKTWRQLQARSFELGQCASVDDIYTTLRGVRTLGVRLAEHERNALVVAKWLEPRPEVDHLRHPAFSSCPGHEYFKRDFEGSTGLFSFVLKRSTQEALNAMLDNMQHFKMGFSWGGYESLILATTDFSGRRTATQWPASDILIRLHIGLEDSADLIQDLEAGFERFNRHFDANA